MTQPDETVQIVKPTSVSAGMFAVLPSTVAGIRDEGQQLPVLTITDSQGGALHVDLSGYVHEVAETLAELAGMVAGD